MHPRLSWLARACVAAGLLAAACAPAAPSPTAAPAKPTEAPKPALSKAEGPAATAAPAKPTEAPAAKPAEAKPALSKAEGPAASPAAKPAEAKPAASPAAKTDAKPALSKAEGPAAKVDAKAIEDFYRGKTIRMIVGLAAGGGYDTYTRAMAKYFGKYVPGNPTVIVENMVGASGLVAANHTYKVAPQDGTVIHNFVGGLSLQELLKAPGIEFESTKFQWLGVPTPDSFVCVVTRQAGIKDLREARTRATPLNIGGIGPGGSTDDTPKLVRAATGAKLKVITGYAGTSQIRLAMDRGEVDGACYAWESIKATSSEQVQKGDYVVIGQAPEEPLKDLPNVPRFLDQAENEEGKQLIMNGVVARSRMERPYLVGPGVPMERVLALRDAFMKTLADPGFLEDAQKARLDVAPITGEEVEKRVRDIFAMPDALKNKFKEILTATE
jgi:tripartite-type tricarboxylate transporter receptor subunit TctC